MRDILIGCVAASLVTWVLCGLAYPLALTALGQWLMPWQANGSLETDCERQCHRLAPDRTSVGWARMVPRSPFGDHRTDPKDPTKPCPRPTTRQVRRGSNLGPTSKVLFAAPGGRPGSAGNRRSRSSRAAMLPADMLTTSASGLDPDISPANAALQVARVARARGVPPTDINALLDTPHHRPQFPYLR